MFTSSNSEEGRSFLNLERLIDLIFRYHTSLAEDSDLEPFKLNNTVAWSDKKEPEIGVLNDTVHFSGYN